MPEVPYAREDHRNAVLVGRPYHLFVPYRPAGLDDGGDAVLRGHVDVVPEREEGVRGHYRALDLEASVSGLLRGYPRRIYAGHLSGAYADRPAVSGEDDCVALHVLADVPREEEVFELLFVRPALCGCLEISRALDIEALQVTFPVKTTTTIYSIYPS